ncbi:DUF2950 domain-containing protein [Uliginosibacterium sp. sgz301328]|uniref:DUF2950 domain-containing protein n=1 Tax=Uliginosibacterium sp. sgz301328 TaxID=3243764 RepID=UPI00359CC0F0
MTLDTLSRSIRLTRALLWAACIALALPVSAASNMGRAFPTPEAAAEALVSSVKAADVKAVVAILGADSRNWVLTGDGPTDRRQWGNFVTAYDVQHTIRKEDEKRATLIVGKEQYPFSFPILLTPGGWRFDGAEGKEELINRRVGMNELSTIEVLRAIVDAQREYALMKRGDNMRGYATRFASTPGKRDGLYWPAAEGQPPSPLGPLVADAQAEGYTARHQGQPYHGYRFRMLGAQGPLAIGGAEKYVTGSDVGGFAVIAYPAQYGLSGVKTFMVNQEGVVLERDLGAKTASIASRMTVFNPEPGWMPVIDKR